MQNGVYDKRRNRAEADYIAQLVRDEVTMRLLCAFLSAFLIVMFVGGASKAQVTTKAQDSTKRQTTKAQDSTKPQDLILGKWRYTEKIPGPDKKELEVTVTEEYLKDGTLKGTAEITKGELPPGAPKVINMEGKYRFIDDKTMERETPGKDGKTEKEKIKIESISKDKLVASDEKGEKKEFTRVP